MNEIPKVVFSTTLTRADWAETRIAGGDLAEDIAQLKREPGGVILAHGGATFIHALIRDGLIDEYRLVIHPVAIGHGTGLFSSLAKPLRLELVKAQTYPSGTAIKIYRPRSTEPGLPELTRTTTSWKRTAGRLSTRPTASQISTCRWASTLLSAAA
jgi:dihydrofolate reductase